MSCLSTGVFSKNAPILHLLLMIVGVLLLVAGALACSVAVADYWYQKPGYEQYQNTSCLTTAYEFVETRCSSCDGLIVYHTYSCEAEDCYNEVMSVSYITWNGTLVNSTVRTRLSRFPHYARQIGSHHECFYKTKNVTSMVWEVSYEKHSLTILFVSCGILGLSCVVFVGAFSMKKQEENENGSSRYTQARTKSPTLHDIRENPNETIPLEVI
ncbi:unnamed protein product [Rotaria socialis]|uniref:Uncharacterized protein n=1 Tax=Rotaria socialis TaxID=392032 RepID=A0A817QW74_9BILA|nr:unnamed protein product [Rotaria socialis]CAF4092321.1 unnamed protein product [Rotaria socialis]